MARLPTDCRACTVYTNTMTYRLPQDVMDLIEDMLDCELVPQVYVLENASEPWRPVLRDEPYEPPCLVPGVRRDAPERHETDPYGFDGDDVWDIL